jgi:hypothetical protein
MWVAGALSIIVQNVWKSSEALKKILSIAALSPSIAFAARSLSARRYAKVSLLGMFF